MTLFAQEEKFTPIKLQLQWKHQFEFAGFYAAKERGYYKDVGLKVSFVEYSPSVDVLDALKSGAVDFGISYSSIIAAYLQGEPLIFVANFLKQSPLAIVTQSQYHLPSDLVGKKVMGIERSIDSATILMMFQKFNTDIDSLQTISTNFSIEDFVNKKIDAMTVFTTNETYELDKRGIKYNLLNPTVYGAEFYDVNLFTSQAMLQKKPKIVKNFRDASIKGWQYALKHKDEIIKLILKKYNTQNKSYEALLYEANDIENLMLPSIYPIGSIDNKRVLMMAENFKELGLISKDTPLNFDAFIFKDAQSSLLKLSKEEQNYLKNKKVIKICADPHWMPLEAIENGKYTGLAAEYMKIISKKLNIPIEVLPTHSWSDSLEKAKKRECDIFAIVTEDTQKKSYMDFTTPYLHASLVVATRSDMLFMDDINLYKNEYFGVVKGYSLKERIQKQYPNLKIVDIPNLKEGLNMVVKKELFGVLDNSMSLSYQIYESFLGMISISGKLDVDLSFGVATRSDAPQLHSIFEKALKSISLNSREEILQKWFHVTKLDSFDYKLLWQILGVLLLITLAIVYKQYLLHKYNTKLHLLNATLEDKIESAKKDIQEKDFHLMQQSKMAAMGEMIENIAHQWRQPLAQVNSSVFAIDTALREDNINNTQVENKLLEIESLTQYMSDTIHDFQNFFNPTQEKEQFKLSEVVSNSSSIVKGLLKSKKIELSITLLNDTLFNGYKNNLQQVVLILMNNAIDSLILHKIDDAKISITVDFKESNYIISLCDNAKGVDASIIENIFDPYFSTKHKAKGTGLGLYISKMIIEDGMKGQLRVKNQIRGCCFTITIPKENIS